MRDCVENFYLLPIFLKIYETLKTLLIWMKNIEPFTRYYVAAIYLLFSAKLVLEYKVSSTAICHVSAARSIKLKDN